jgi:hypothetical protein
VDATKCNKRQCYQFVNIIKKDYKKTRYNLVYPSLEISSKHFGNNPGQKLPLFLIRRREDSWKKKSLN